MLRALFTSATGMRAQEQRIDATANNLANVNTNGFKRSIMDFADLLYTTTRQPGTEVGDGQITPTGLQIGSGVRAVGTTKIFTPGVLEETGNSTDVAIEGNGFFRVLLPGNEERFTRDGAFRIDGVTGRLVNGDGYFLDGDVTVDPTTNPTTIGIAPNGRVTALTPDGEETVLGNILLYTFANPSGLSSVGGNLYQQTAASGDPIEGAPQSAGYGSLRNQFIERSNVEVVTELVSLISAQRAYEINSRAIRAGDEMLATTSDIVR